MKKTFTDREIIDALRKGGSKEDQVLRFLYQEYKGMIQQFINKNNGSSEEGKDVFQDALIALYENIKSGKFKGDSTISSYLYSIARFMWLNRLKRKNIEWKILDSQPKADIEDSHLPSLLEKESQQKVMDLFAQLGEQCKTILVYAIYREYNMREISQKMNYENEQVARNKKYKCLKRLKALIAKQPGLIGLLKK